MQTVILAGGLGTRLGALTRRLPKPMVPVGKVPFLEHLLRRLARQSLHDVLLLTGYLGEQIETYFGSGSRFGFRLRYSRERWPLGTGGALREASDRLAPSFLLLYGDSLLPVRYIHIAHRLQDSAALGALAVYHDPGDETGVRPNVALERGGLVTKYQKADGVGSEMEYVEAGVSCFRREVLELLPATGPASLEQCVFPALAARRLLAAWPTRQRFYDIGTPERLRTIEDYLRISEKDPDARLYCR